jgi:hypothetical protein
MSKSAYEKSVKTFSPTIIMSGNTSIDLEEIKKHEKHYYNFGSYYIIREGIVLE